MKLFNKLKNLVNNPSSKSAVRIYTDPVSADLSIDRSQREKAIFGEQEIELKKLYEKWAVMEKWKLKEQAIPLLLALDPENLCLDDETIQQQYNDLWQHAQHCVEQDLLNINNKEHSSDEWEGRPLDIYKWAAVSRVTVPHELSTLMEFVMATLMPVENHKDKSSSEHKNTAESYNRDKERLLGAAVAVLAKYPEETRNSKGRVSVQNILYLIDKNKEEYFGEDEISLSGTAGLDLLKQWID